ncbi:Site-specific recombinase XerD [Alkalithermobacter thermoalcaliphilus JW-YL-7 = DSM 7308]|uniref:Integrase family protein n=1 Tax=Alkalithermobacter thermoalcaliphilus JW-YL-7 = DSM 7308 TaxID=1121328 RepID=A0A150FQI9_CLOPD|nr:integrase family protein [[Clostridium] paradoxum JW-YL-7 = DSM 7308]SHK80891.1 Site-specific recombinase XerD [[Clostridium] paradoxum JW-YL-7 = DSM 7308]
MHYFTEYEQAVIEKFLEKLKKYTKNDYINKLSLFKSSISKYDKDLFHVEVEDCKNFIEFIQNKYAKSTCEKIYGYLHSFYNFLYKHGYIETNPFKFVKKPSVSRMKTKDDVMSFDEVNRLVSILDKLNIRDRVIVVFLLTTGCLLSELVSIKWKDFIIDEKNNYYCKIGSKKKERIIKLHPYLWELIIDYRKNLGMKYFFEPTDEFIFKGKDNQSITDRNIRLIVKKALSLAGLEKYSCKDFRHSFASFSLKLGCPDETIKQHLGWSDKYYAIRYKYVINFLDDQPIDYIMSTNKLKINDKE